jgi:hypothetical protein
MIRQMTTYLMESAVAQRTHELAFAGDGVRLAGQIDYPTLTSNLYPLVFVLPHAGCNTRKGYTHYAEMALSCGFAVFRWDKRGTGRSGAGGRGSTTQDAVNAYEVALSQARIDNSRIVILAQGEGTLMLGSSYGLFARHQALHGVILADNMLDASSITAIDTRIQIMQGDNDWRSDWEKLGRDAAYAHRAAYRHGASHFLARGAGRMLLDEGGNFNEAAQRVLKDWLLSL